MEHVSTMIITTFYLSDAANSGKSVLSEGTNVFVLLVCWVYREEMCN